MASVSINYETFGSCQDIGLSGTEYEARLEITKHKLSEFMESQNRQSKKIKSTTYIKDL